MYFNNSVNGSRWFKNKKWTTKLYVGRPSGLFFTLYTQREWVLQPMEYSRSHISSPWSVFKGHTIFSLYSWKSWLWGELVAKKQVQLSYVEQAGEITYGWSDYVFHSRCNISAISTKSEIIQRSVTSIPAPYNPWDIIKEHSLWKPLGPMVN